jgi:hypothetical protein
MNFLTTDEFSELLEGESMTVFPDGLACFAYERDSLEPTPEELVRLYYTTSSCW